LALSLSRQSFRALTQDEYCNVKDQQCTKDSDCLLWCYADCYPCNDRANCDTLEAFGLIAPENSTDCFSIYTADGAARAGVFRDLLERYA
jgi:hypothetical protein